MNLLGVSLQTLSAVSSIALTAMSTIVAGVALIFSFRQNVGWAPVILVTNSQLSGKGGEWRFKIKIDVEFWNRRKYPMVVRHLKTRVTGVELLRTTPASEREGYVSNNVVTSRPDCVVDPNGHGRYSVEAEFEHQMIDALTPLFHIKLVCFDPYRNRDVTLEAEHRFFYPEIGWKKTSKQRETIRQLRGPWLEKASPGSSGSA